MSDAGPGLEASVAAGRIHAQVLVGDRDVERRQPFGELGQATERVISTRLLHAASIGVEAVAPQLGQFHKDVL